MTIDRLKELYDDYIFDMNAASQSSLRTAFGNLVMGSGNRDACNIRFAEKAEKALAAFDFDAEDPAEILDFVLCKGTEYRDDLAVSLMMMAMQRYLLPFIENVTPEKAAAVLRWYDENFEKRDLTPVMVSCRKALKKRAGRA